MLNLSDHTQIYATPEHPFFTNGEYINAEDLPTNASLKTVDGRTLFVEKIDLVDTLAMVFNFTVEGNHNYFVGKQGVLVHNDLACFLQRLSDSKIDFTALSKKLDELSEADQLKFVKDFEKADDDILKQLNAEGAKLVDAWEVARGTDLATDIPALGKISNYLESGADVNVFKADMLDVLSTGNQSLKNQWLNTLGDDSYILLRRGTDRYSDISAFDQSGYMLSDAARTKYIESGGNLEEALNYADEVHQQWLDIFDGDIYKYAQEHSLKGNFEMEEMYGLKRTLVSFTSDKSKIDNFIPDGGQVFIGVFEKSKIVKQTLNTSNEGEYLIIGGTEIFNIIP